MDPRRSPRVQRHPARRFPQALARMPISPGLLDARSTLREQTCASSPCIGGARRLKRGEACLLGDAPVISSEGRMFPVDTRYLGRNPAARIEDTVAEAIVRALREQVNSVLAFTRAWPDRADGERHRRSPSIRPSPTSCPCGMAVSASPPNAVRSRPREAPHRAFDLDRGDIRHHRRRRPRIVVDSGLARVPLSEMPV